MADNQAPHAARDVEMNQYIADRGRVNEDKLRQDDEIIEQFGEYGYGWHDSDAAGEAAKKASMRTHREISADKHEPEWMLDMRLRGYRAFIEQPMPKWGVDLSGFHAQDFKYYVKPVGKQAASWEDLLRISEPPTTGWAYPKPRRAAWFPVLRPSTNPRSSTTPFRMIFPSRASSSSIPTQPYVSTRSWCRNTSERSSP